MKVENAEPQTIEADDGFPIENLKFCGYAQEVMAVIQNRKPVSISEFDTNYIPMDFVTSLKSKKKKVAPYHDCKHYTYDQVYKASKKVNLLRSVLKIEEDVLYYYFLKENMKDAYLLSMLWERKHGLENYNLEYDESNIIIGVLFGYKKKDIRAWFMMELQELFHINFDYLDKRSSIVQNPKIQKKRNELANQFEDSWKSALEKLETMRKDISVPKGWKAKLQKLPAPGSRSTTRKRIQ